ncbi:MAG: gluconate 2-dehydrogenase subunit 3 family protein [Terriglobia bacterium]
MEDEKGSEAKSNQDPKDQEANAMTRREWLQGIGGAALAAGLPAIPRVEAPISRLQDGIKGTSLPLGLYAPSPVHLGHALEAESRFHAVPPGSKTDYAVPIAGPFRPAFFSQSEFQMVRQVAGILLGLGVLSENSSSGLEDSEDSVETVAQTIDLHVASAEGVSAAVRALSSEHRALAAYYYGAEAVNRLETDDAGDTCREGLVWLNREAQHKYAAGFLELTESQQTLIIKTVSDDRPDLTRENAGVRFFNFMKVEAIRGYYTSRTGLKELDDRANAFYSASPGCPDAPKTGHDH